MFIERRSWQNWRHALKCFNCFTAAVTANIARGTRSKVGPGASTYTVGASRLYPYPNFSFLRTWMNTMQLSKVKKVDIFFRIVANVFARTYLLSLSLPSYFLRYFYYNIYMCCIRVLINKCAKFKGSGIFFQFTLISFSILPLLSYVHNMWCGLLWTWKNPSGR